MDTTLLQTVPDPASVFIVTEVTAILIVGSTLEGTEKVIGKQQSVPVGAVAP